MLDAFRKYDRGYGQIVLQCNVEDDMLGVPEYAVTKHNVDAIEFKFGQSAKGTQPVRKLKDRQAAIQKQDMGMLVFPNPMDPEIIEKAENGCCPNFYSYARLPLWDETYLIPRAVVSQIIDKMKVKGLYVPEVAITGGFSSEDHLFKALAFGNQNVNYVGFCRSAMTAAMTGKTIGEKIKKGDIPKSLQKYGETIDKIYHDLADLRAIYGTKANDFPLGAVGVFSYLNKLAFGLKHFAALNRKFDVTLLDRSDLIPLTREAKMKIVDKAIKL